MDPLSEVLALTGPQSLSCGGFPIPEDIGICFPKHQRIKCYAMLTGQCWLDVESEAEPILLNVGDCFILPRGLPFRLAADLSLPPIHYTLAWNRMSKTNEMREIGAGTRFMAGGFFAFAGSHAEMLLQSLPPVVHIRRESDKAAMRWARERLSEELRDPQPGSSLIAQQLAYTRSLAERVGMSRSVFALRFLQTMGTRQSNTSPIGVCFFPPIAGRTPRTACLRSRGLLVMNLKAPSVKPFAGLQAVLPDSANGQLQAKGA